MKALPCLVAETVIFGWRAVLSITRNWGSTPSKVAPFENGQRICTEKCRYEWWYFDANLEDGATIVVVFYTKPNVSPNGPLSLRVTINITLPDGRTFDKLAIPIGMATRVIS
jgi:hypothetical protein